MRLTAWVAMGAGLALAGLALVPAAFGLERVVVEGGSMGSTIPRGSIVYEREVPVARLRVGDVITYTPPGAAARVTHRLVWAGRGSGGRRSFRTKGDANATADPWRFELDHPRQARVVAHVPLAGYALAALGLRWVRMLAIGVPALLVGLAALRRPRAPAVAEA